MKKNIRQPKQKRSIQTRRQIKDAAFQLFAQKGIHGTNSKEIVELAGVSIGSFYSYFKNKKTLLLEMLEDHCDRVFMTIWQPLNGYTFKEASFEEARRVIEGVFEAYKIAPEFHRQTHALRYSDPDINRIYDRERKRETDQIRLILEQFLSHQEDEVLSSAAIVIHNLVESVVHTYKFLGPEMDKDTLIDQVAKMIVGYLRVYDINT